MFRTSAGAMPAVPILSQQYRQCFRGAKETWMKRKKGEWRMKREERRKEKVNKDEVWKEQRIRIYLG